MLWMRFVVACLMEESGHPMNWVAKLSHDLGKRMWKISSRKRLGLNAFEHRVFFKVLESVHEEWCEC
jgi:hypothetical protein